MPIKIPADLPAYAVLTREGVMVMDEDHAARQDIRPLRIALLNLMPKKIQTENQFARLIGATPLQIEFSLIRMTEHQLMFRHPDQGEFDLQRRRADQPGELVLRLDLLRHQVEQGDAQRADVLPGGVILVHDHDTLARENSVGGQVGGDLDGHLGLSGSVGSERVSGRRARGQSSR